MKSEVDDFNGDSVKRGTKKKIGQFAFGAAICCSTDELEQEKQETSLRIGYYEE